VPVRRDRRLSHNYFLDVLGPTRRLSWMALVLATVVASACGTSHSAANAEKCTGPVQSFHVSSAAMTPTIKIGQHVIVDHGAYRTASPQRGDIVVFTPPPTAVAPGVEYIIKRVIGLPGEGISSSQTGQLSINGQPTSQPWLSQAARQDPGPPIVSQTIPAGKYYVLGDNRGDSQDSRYFGPIPRSSIVGKVMLHGCH